MSRKRSGVPQKGLLHNVSGLVVYQSFVSNLIVWTGLEQWTGAGIIPELDMNWLNSGKLSIVSVLWLFRRGSATTIGPKC
jgi:hypothetical protein